MLKGQKRTEEQKAWLRMKALQQFANGMPLETRKKISVAHKGKKKPPRTESHKLNLSLSKRGKTSTLKGHSYLQRYGETKAIKVKQKIVNTRRERNSYIPWNKGIRRPPFSREWIEKGVQARRGKKRSDITRRQISESNIGKHNYDAEVRAKISRKHKLNWQDEEYRIKHLNIVMNSLKLRPTLPERIMIELITKHNLQLDYVGDGKVWFRGVTKSYNPDFIDRHSKLILEVFGDYWHNKEVNLKNDIERLNTYKQHGYKIIVIWEHELVGNKYGEKLSEEELRTKLLKAIT